MPQLVLNVPYKGMVRFVWKATTEERRVIHRILEEFGYFDPKPGKISGFDRFDKLFNRMSMLNDPVKFAKWLSNPTELQDLLQDFIADKETSENRVSTRNVDCEKRHKEHICNYTEFRKI